jgi:hypothetical protein
MERFAASAMTALLGFQAYATSHRAIDLGLLGLAEAAPGITLVLHGGHVADRVSRQRIVWIATVLLGVLALVLAGLTIAARTAILPGLYAVAFLAGVIRAYENPAATGLEAQVVPAATLMPAIALLATTSRLADVAGPIAGGFAWAAIGPGASYAAIGTVFILAGMTLRVGVPARAPPPHPDRAAWREIADGVRFVFADQVLVGSMALDLFAVFFGGATALLPVFATDILHVGPVGFGFLRSAIGVGSLMAALAAPRLLPQRFAGWTLHAVVGGFGLSMIVFGVSRSLVLSLAALAVAGFCDGASVIIRRAILRLASPEAMRGRIGAVKSIFIGSSNELGTFESGVAASLLGASAAVWGGGLLTLLIVATTGFAMPKLRRLNLLSLARQAASREPEAPAPDTLDAADGVPEEATPGLLPLR